MLRKTYGVVNLPLDEWDVSQAQDNGGNLADVVGDDRLVEAVLDARVEAAEAVAGCQDPPPIEQTAAATAKLGELAVLGHGALTADLLKTEDLASWRTLGSFSGPSLMLVRSLFSI